MSKTRDSVLRLVEVSQEFYLKAYPMLTRVLAEFKDDRSIMEPGGKGFIYGSTFAYFESAISTMNLALLLAESCILPEDMDMPAPPTSTTLN